MLVFSRELENRPVVPVRWRCMGNESSENSPHVVLFVIKPPPPNCFLFGNLTVLCSQTGKQQDGYDLMQLHHKAVVSLNWPRDLFNACVHPLQLEVLVLPSRTAATLRIFPNNFTTTPPLREIAPTGPIYARPKRALRRVPAAPSLEVELKEAAPEAAPQLRPTGPLQPGRGGAVCSGSRGQAGAPLPAPLPRRRGTSLSSRQWPSNVRHGCHAAGPCSSSRRESVYCPTRHGASGCQRAESEGSANNLFDQQALSTAAVLSFYSGIPGRVCIPFLKRKQKQLLYRQFGDVP